MKKCISGDVLKLIALTAMLCDHLWATIVSGNLWMSYVGRLAFPIFAYQIAVGYEHTRSFRRYALRLLIFALISEIPFNYIFIGGWFYPFHQNVMFTLLYGLLSIRAVDKMLQNPSVKQVLLSCLQVLLLAGLGAATFTDYGALGVLTVVCFYIGKKLPWEKLWQVCFLVVFFQVLFKGQYIPVTIFGRVIELTKQSFCVLSLIPIWLSTDERKWNSKGWQYFSYWFYPAHMMVLYLLSCV